MSRPDSLTFNVSFNLPPEIIREFFDGMARVATAKGNGVNNSVATLQQIITPLLAKKEEKSNEETKVETKVDASLLPDNLIKIAESMGFVPKQTNTEEISEEKSEKVEETVSSPKKPVYKEEPPTNLFPGGNGGIPDMSKMLEAFGPMMKGMASMMNPNQEVKTETTVVKKSAEEISVSESQPD